MLLNGMNPEEQNDNSLLGTVEDLALSLKDLTWPLSSNRKKKKKYLPCILGFSTLKVPPLA